MPFDLCKIGQLLKHAREEKGLALDEVSHALCLRKSMIEAIESGKWQGLPHLVYVKGYATQYASFVDALHLVHAELASEEDTPPQEERQGASAPQPAAPRHPGLWIKGAVAVGMAGIVVAFLIFENTQRPAYVAPLRQHQTVQNGYGGVAADQGALYQKVAADQGTSYQKVAADQGATYQKVAADPAAGAYDNQEEKIVLETKKLMIACQERTWVRVVIDGSEMKEVMMNPDEVLMFNAKEKFDLIIGNAGGVKVFYNGKDTGFTGEDGEVKRVNLS